MQGTVEEDVPSPALWEAFAHPDWWPRWNRCFFWARAAGLSEDETDARVQISDRNLSMLPSYNKGALHWATAESNVRWAYRLQAGTRR